MSQAYDLKKSLQNLKSKQLCCQRRKLTQKPAGNRYSLDSISARDKWCERTHCSSITHDTGLSPFTLQWTCDFSLKYSHLTTTSNLYLWPRLQYWPSGTRRSPTLLLGSSFSKAFGRHYCGSSPKYTCSLDCVGATSVIAYLVSNYPCLSHSQPTQALIEFLSLWVMSYLS